MAGRPLFQFVLEKAAAPFAVNQQAALAKQQRAMGRHLEQPRPAVGAPPRGDRRGGPLPAMLTTEGRHVGVQIAAGQRGLDQKVMQAQVMNRHDAGRLQGEPPHTLVVHVVTQLVEGEAPRRIERPRLPRPRSGGAPRTPTS